MGGHSLSRKSTDFKKVARISCELARSGYLMISGGGPGAMEATHLGARFAGYSETDLGEAIRILSTAPLYPDPRWLSTAFEVIERFPARQHKGVWIESVGIPTWLYGHEPTTPFASKIAKYFANSVREEGLLALAVGGVIFAPGSAGTIQEIFQDACQNHYESFGLASPMAFLNKRYWQEEKPVYPLLTRLAAGEKYASLLSISDESETIVRAIMDFKP
jgi:predicted Rossmann-fold nucleotide-binding protein